MTKTASPVTAPPRGEVSVVVVNFNGRRHLPALFDSLARQVRPADQVVLVDNASTDASAEWVRDAFPWVDVVALAENVGFAAGNNVGLATARGELIALLNPDTTVDERWLAELLDTLAGDERIGAVVPKIYRAGSPPTIEQAGAEFNNLGHCWTRGYNQPDRGQFDTDAEVPALTGCSVLVRRAALGGEELFDPRLFMYYEEFELSLRLRGRGYRVVYNPRSVVVHTGMQSVRQATAEPLLLQQEYCNRNRLKILCKYYPLPLLARNLPLILLSIAYWDALFLLRSGPARCLRAITAQARFAARGLWERRAARSVEAARWLPWMTSQGLRQVRALRAARGGA